jgi:hypothetical protein
MQSEIQDYYDIFQNNTQNLFAKLIQWSKGLKEKEIKVNKLLLELMEKEEEIKSYQKVSFIASMNKQLEEKNILIKHLENKITKLESKMNNNNNFKEETISENMFIDSESIDKEEDGLVEIEYKKNTYLLENSTQKVYKTNNKLEKLAYVGNLKKGKVKLFKKKTKNKV